MKISMALYFLKSGIIMLLNKKNVERCGSQDAGYSNEGHKMKIRADKITVMLDVNVESKLYKFLYKRLRYTGNKSWKHYETRLIKNKHKDKRPDRYRWAILIFKNGRMLIHIDFDPINKHAAAVRLDIRPQHLEPEEMDKLIKWLDDRMKGELLALLRTAWITQVDVALDLYGCWLDDYIWGVKRIRRDDSYLSTDGLPGVRLGSVRSDLHMLVYEKVDITGSTRKFREVDGKLEINLNDHPMFLRIEARVKPDAKPGSKRKKGKQKEPVMLKELHKMANPFERLEVYKTGLDTYLEIDKFFRERPKSFTLNAWKRHMRLSQNTRRISRKIEGIIEKHKIELFDKEQVWKLWTKCLKRLGLLVR
ncbi:hypothetical protein [Lelliottia wanjuensis]|uniref:hypothetical protein n=1 Tax=Lelliottia wanjuensis TaxID=3050585 RepID=UPI00254F23D7|nr:hypothetical protein [Lelliottia sp. V86_10]MDK9585016.1 hypothetical protein [Lelliottia sp. V86_10]